MKKKNFYIPSEDISLFNRMEREATSDEERTFFKKLYDDEAHVQTVCGQIYVDEKDNSDKIFFIRRYNHEYELDHAMDDAKDKPGGYYDSLADALNAYLDEIKLSNEHITLLEWLRKQSFACVKYDRNLDNV